MLPDRAELRPNTPEYQFARWKHAVGLPDSFPVLKPLESDDLVPDKKLYFGLNHLEALEYILDIASSHAAFVRVREGQGCTTLSNYVLRDVAQEGLRRGLIPVRVSMDDILKERDTKKTFEEMARYALVRSLVAQKWERPLGQSKYADLLGITPEHIRISTSASEPTDVYANAFERVLIIRQNTLNNLIVARKILIRGELTKDNNDTMWEMIGKIAPKLSQLDTLVDFIKSTHFLRVSLQLDLSSNLVRQDQTQYRQRVQELGQAIRSASERLGTDFFNELYFGSQEAFDVFNKARGLPNNYQTISYPPYDALDLFSILSQHHKPNREPSLATVLDPNLLTPHINEGKPIVQVIDDFRRDLIGRLDRIVPTYRFTSS